MMTKRRRLVIEAILLTFGLLATQFVAIGYRYLAILLLAIFCYFFTAFNLREDLKGISWLMNLLLPSLYTAAVALFYFLLPEAIVTRVIILVFFAIGMYAILLIENIFTISASRTIQLVRSAQAVGFLMTLVTSFLFYDTILSFKQSALLNGLLVFIISSLLIGPALWSVVLSERVEKQLINYTLVLALLVGQFSFIISFWPLEITAASLFLISSLYVLLGIAQSKLTGRLFKNTLIEYLRVGLVVLVIIVFLGRWG
jgi:hypothetical protein